MQPPTYSPDPSPPIDPLDYWDSSNAVPPIRLNRSWSRIWKQVFFNPSLNTYLDVLQEPDKSLNRSLKWITALWLIGLGLQIVLSLLLGAAVGDPNELQTTTFGNRQTATTSEFNSVTSNICFLIVCMPFLIAIGLVFYLIFYCGVPHVAALILGGSGNFESVVFLYSAIYSMMLVVGTGLSMVGFGLGGLLLLASSVSLIIIVYLGMLAITLALLLYVLILQIIAMNAIHHFGWIKATISALALYILFFGCYCSCIGLLVFSGGSSS